MLKSRQGIEAQLSKMRAMSIAFKLIDYCLIGKERSVYDALARGRMLGVID